MTVKVIMSLTERDISNSDSLAKLTNAHTKAQAVSTALSVTKLIAERLSDGSEVYIKDKDGHVERMFIA